MRIDPMIAFVIMLAVIAAPKALRLINAATGDITRPLFSTDHEINRHAGTVSFDPNETDRFPVLDGVPILYGWVSIRKSLIDTNALIDANPTLWSGRPVSDLFLVMDSYPTETMPFTEYLSQCSSVVLTAIVRLNLKYGPFDGMLIALVCKEVYERVTGLRYEDCHVIPDDMRIEIIKSRVQGNSKLAAEIASTGIIEPIVDAIKHSNGFLKFQFNIGQWTIPCIESIRRIVQKHKQAESEGTHVSHEDRAKFIRDHDVLDYWGIRALIVIRHSLTPNSWDQAPVAIDPIELVHVDEVYAVHCTTVSDMIKVYVSALQCEDFVDFVSVVRGRSELARPVLPPVPSSGRDRSDVLRPVPSSGRDRADVLRPVPPVPIWNNPDPWEPWGQPPSPEPPMEEYNPYKEWLRNGGVCYIDEDGIIPTSR